MVIRYMVAVKASKFELRLDEVNDMDLFVRQSAYPQLTLTSSSSPSYASGEQPRKKAKGSNESACKSMSIDDFDFEFGNPILASRRNESKGKGKRKKGAPMKDEDEGERKPRIVLMHDLPHLMASYSNARSGGASFGTDSGGDARNAEKAEALARLLPSFGTP